MCVEADQAGMGAEVTQQSLAPPGVLRGDHRDLAQDFRGPAGQVAQVAQRSRDDEEGAGHPA